MPWSKESWRDVVGYEGVYAVSNMGRVKRIERTNNYPAGHILKASSIRDYPRVSLTRGAADRKSRTVHTLVAEAFLGMRPKGREVNHKNGNKADNRVCNLEWVTRSENALHATYILKVPKPKGEQHGHSKLTKLQILEMRKLRRQGWLQSDLCEKFCMTQPAVSRILRGLRWGHVGGY